MLRRSLVLLWLTISCAGQALAQPDSSQSEISLLTCSPGEDLYSLFGHTAIRVRDPQKGLDLVYNYGTFDDSDPLFYFHFTRGIMIYSLAEESFGDFMMEYADEHRAVIAQILDLTPAEKERLIERLGINAQDKNRFYQYHFYADNCTTRAGKILASAKTDSASFSDILPDPRPTYRQCIHEYLDRGHRDWAKFGIDIMLGSHLDEKPDIQQERFLPDLLMKGFDHARAGGKPLVQEKQLLLPSPDSQAPPTRFSPVLFCWIVFFAAGLLTFIRVPFLQASVRIFDISLFLILGLLGCIMSYVWIVRVDTVCRNNMNLCWAIPFHLGIVFFIRKQASWTAYYFLATAILAILLVLGWKWWPQELNAAVFPLCLLIALRAGSIYLQWKRK
jgi:Domain of unknown function (DUF4105)